MVDLNYPKQIEHIESLLNAILTCLNTSRENSGKKEFGLSKIKPFNHELPYPSENKTIKTYLCYIV